MSLPRADMVAATGPDGMIYAIAGYTTAGGWQMSGEVYNTTSDTWSSIASMLSWRLYEGGTIGPDGRIYEMGNAGPGNEMDAYNPIDTTGSDSVSLSIAKGTPAITWADPADIVSGTALGAAQLDATASISGTFTYTPAAGDVLSPGLGQTLSVSFTPDDIADYDPTTATATIGVLAPPTITIGSPTAVVGQALDDLPVATFTDSTFPDATADDFSATIIWAGGSTSAGTITADPDVPGQFDVTVSGASPSTVAGGESFRVSVSAVGQGTPGSWSSVGDLGSDLGELAAASSGGVVYAIGGYSDDGDSAVVEAYDPTSQTVTTVASLPDAVEDLAAATGPDGTIYAIGGDDESSSALDTVYAYSPATDTWTQVASLPIGRSGVAAAAGPDGKIYAIGGYDGDEDTDEVDAYDPATDTWTTVAPLPDALEGAAATMGPDGRIYVIGGQDDSGYSDQVFAYDTTTNTWAQVADLPDAVAYLAAATASDGTIYAIGGDDSGGNELATVYAYDVATDTWSQAASLPDGLEELAAAMGGDGEVYAVGGYTQSGNASGFVALSNPVVPVATTEGVITLAPGEATSFTITGGTNGTAGGGQTITVTAYDQYGNVATGYDGTVAFSSTDHQAVLPADAMLANGVGTFPVTLDTAGAQSITATDTLTPSLTGTESGLDITPGEATHLGFSGATGSTAGSAGSITVTAYDAYGNVATGYDGTLQLTSTDPGATLPANVMLSGGVATFSATFDTAGASRSRRRTPKTPTSRPPISGCRSRRVPRRTSSSPVRPVPRRARRRHSRCRPWTPTGTWRPGTPARSTSPAATPMRPCPPRSR